MLDAATVVSVLAAFTLGAVAVYAALARSRGALQQQATAAQSALAMVELRLTGLMANQASLNETHQQLEGRHQELLLERERLATTLERTIDDLQRRSDALAVLQQRLEATEDSKRAVETNLQMSVFRGEELVAQVIALEARVRLFEQEARSQTGFCAEVAAQAKALETERNGLLVRLTEQKAWIEEQNQLVEQKITNIAAQLLEDKSRKFTELNRRELDALVTPFKEQLGEFRQRVDHIYAADTRDRGQLQEQVAHLARLNQTVSQQAQALTKALTISSKSTGDWGELVLRRILEDSELRADKEYVLQQTVNGDDESRQRPDAIVSLPEGRQVVVDAKVSNKSWTEYCAAADDETRSLRLAAHIASLRAHIRELSARDYPRSPDLQTVDFVLMFVPVEAALLTALAHDDALYQEAYRSKIVLVTPTTLMLALKLVESMWLFQRRKESTDKIAEAGRKLYEKLTLFADTFVDIGVAIERAHGTFEKAKGQLATGRGNVVRLAQRMVELGVGPGAGRVMPRSLEQLAETEDDDAIEQAGAAVAAGVPGENVRQVLQ
jgi:DNA recombination protein RmuC